MKDVTFEAQLIAAAPHTHNNNDFVRSTMAKVKALNPKQKTNLVFWPTHLHKPALALLALTAMALIGGVVYAAVNFAPALIEVLTKGTNSRGATEYTVAGFKDCANYGAPATERFEIKSDAPAITDDEFKKIVQAKCELTWLEGFVRNTWPSYGPEGEWKTGDTIYYTRTHVMGKVKTITDTSASVQFYQDQTSDLNTFEGKKLKAYQGGEEISLSNIQPSDIVFNIVRVSETYTKWASDTPGKATYMPDTNNPTVVGLVALFKLSLPEKYYTEMQAYITEIPGCIGNESEYCPNTGSIDVYPRDGGEGATNPHASSYTPDMVHRQISGEVTELGASTLTLKSRSGKTYKVSVGDKGFEAYNRDYTAAYLPYIDATLRIGSQVSVTYFQKPQDSVTEIAKEHVMRVSLLTESSSSGKKLESMKQY